MLACEIDSPTYDATYFDPRGATALHFPMPEVPCLKAAAVDAGATLTLFLLNRGLDEEMSVDVEALGFGRLSVERATTLRDDDLEAATTKDTPDRIAPAPLAGVEVVDGVRVTLPPASWNVVRLRDLGRLASTDEMSSRRGGL